MCIALHFTVFFSIVGYHLLVQISLGSGDETSMLVYRYSKLTCMAPKYLFYLLFYYRSVDKVGLVAGKSVFGFPNDKESKQPA